MYNVKPKVIPVIIGVTGTISKSFTQNLYNIPGKHEIKEAKKSRIGQCTHTHTHTHTHIYIYIYIYIGKY